ncbi:S41 family peptidase [Aestuariivirga litoralis]|uniref:S41 family peptidase n=1 Tax=Aestuariivirga litoralis TaxID=2650924 RepID=UPI0018C5DDB0|nr:S41 family peptidase [Aestuariivirga litoralis]MBG1233541.1 S41 family peptidase [Aestuariivirga litoralis]
MKLNNRLKNAGLVALGAAAALAGVQAINIATASTNADTYKLLNLFGEVYDRVRSDYVEKPDEQKMMEAAINGMLMSLDPHSSYMNAKESADMNVKTRGEFGGLGIEVTMENGVIKVVAPYDDTPAKKAGIMANDLIVKIDGKEVQGNTLNDSVDKMRGPVGSPVTLTIVRDKKEPFDVKMNRDTIKIESVKYNKEGDDIGYIRISTFNEQAESGLQKAIADLDKQMDGKVKGYILDLRNDPGGLLNQAIGVSDVFMDKGEVVSTRGRLPDQVERYTATKGDLINGKPLVVLINGGSASASEIVAGALQDQKRSTTIGTRSFGKGSVQTIIPLGNEGAIRLTTQRYYTPSGRSIQAKGIDPDILIEEPLPPELQGKNVSTEGEAGLNGHLANPNGGEEGGGSSAYVPEDKGKDEQLKAAIAFIHGEKVVTNVKPADPAKVDDKAKQSN